MESIADPGYLYVCTRCERRREEVEMDIPFEEERMRWTIGRRG
jgi:hypothetical protein